MNDTQFTEAGLLVREKQYAQARSVWQEILTREQDPLFEGEVRCCEALTHLLEGDEASASAALGEIAADAKYPPEVRATALVSRAHALKRLNRLADAIAALDGAIALQPGTRTAQTATWLRDIFARHLHP